jgi:hypothetical protein
MAEGPKKYTFTRHAGNIKKGVEIVNNRYQFTDGKLVVDEVTGALIEPILTGYFGCELKITSEVKEVKVSEEPSLTSTATKPK